MDKVRLSVLGLSYSETQSGAYALVLAEENGERRIPIIIGAFEAQAIAIELEGLKPPRPLTHDLFLQFANAYNIHLKEVNIFKLEEGVFFSNLVFGLDKNVTIVDSRTSDAIALALRFKCPIYTTKQVIDKAGIIIEFSKDADSEKDKGPIENIEINKASDKLKSNKTPYSKYNIKELEALLKEAVRDENYEKASHIRDEINIRKKD
ncbi:MAG: hypothetical protein A2X08_06510 [Bacteroidetes bacterium GWA2_32_17]|nr:MAG: hypothetical protein A2X08_06510 [Bacteroidetes bacterium GWA2_32_17]